ncbi:hypothetical protein K0M31_019363 [Melipona bicolor]|uniref:Uncharacterized protein n=1 Tax=Melipona bicolor TaxID=60889 RepID=A0AA40G2S6_9HYME|nr:hypothetical protein K0M31_019363 [Melipona bicolor]
MKVEAQKLARKSMLRAVLVTVNKPRQRICGGVGIAAIESTEESELAVKSQPSLCRSHVHQPHTLITEEGRGKKFGKKKKKQLQRLLGLAMLFKAKLSLLLQLISTHFQLKFFFIAIITLVLNVVKFWLDLKKSHPAKVVYYEHAQHQHHYDHDDYDHSWARSTNDSPQDLAYSAYAPKN